MFKLRTPCATCPFRKGVGETFQLPRLRLMEILRAQAFQCHKTVNYNDFDDPLARQGEHPQQCAGLMSLLHRAGEPNQIMQVGERFRAFDPSKLTHADVYDTIKDAIKAHSKRVRKSLTR